MHIQAKVLEQTGRPFARFLVFGVFAAVVDFTVFNMVVAASSRTEVTWVLFANTSAFTLAVMTSYLLNARYTFYARWESRSLTRFVMVAVGGAALYNSALLGVRAAVEPESTIELNAAKAAAAMLLVCWNYIGYQRFAFGD